MQVIESSSLNQRSEANSLRANEGSHQTEVSAMELYKKLAGIDCEDMVGQVFEGNIGTLMMPAEVSDTVHLRIRLMMAGLYTVEADELLKRLLLHQLNVGKRHAQIWTTENPDIHELTKSWQEQTRATEQWLLFITAFEKSLGTESLKEAHDLAFERYPFQGLSFNNPQEFSNWKRLLKNEQERDFLVYSQLQAGGVTEELQLDGNDLRYKGESLTLPPVEAALLSCFWDELPHSASELIREVFGSKAITETQTEKLSRRINELNNNMDELFGKRQKPRWISKSTHPQGTAYKLKKPSGSLRK